MAPLRKRLPGRGNRPPHVSSETTLESSQDDPIVYRAAVLELFSGRYHIFADDHAVLVPEGFGCAFDCCVERLVDLIEALSAQGRIRNFRIARPAHDRALHHNSSWDFTEFR